MSERILGIDFGAKRVGLAVSDPTGHFAVGLETLAVSSKRQMLEAIAETAHQYKVIKIIVGLPVSMNGEEGPAAANVRDLAERLSQLVSAPIEFFDERLTSVLALQTLQAQGIKASKNKGLIDQAAAKRILQDYLDRQSHRQNNPL